MSNNEKEKKEHSSSERRQFFRHPISLPLEIKKVKEDKKQKITTIDVSFGGLLFLSKHKVKKDSDIVVAVPFKDKVFKVLGFVVRCDPDTDSKLYQVGISFKRVNDAFKIKLVEQLHLIEEYRVIRSIQLEREISIRQASEEWIERYSSQFHNLYW